MIFNWWYVAGTPWSNPLLLRLKVSPERRHGRNIFVLEVSTIVNIDLPEAERESSFTSLAVFKANTLAHCGFSMINISYTWDRVGVSIPWMWEYIRGSWHLAISCMNSMPILGVKSETVFYAIHCALSFGWSDLDEGSDALETWDVGAPTSIVEGSDRGWVTVVGDLLALTLEVSNTSQPHRNIWYSV